MKKIVVFLALASPSAFAENKEGQVPKLGSGELISPEDEQSISNSRYQLGSEWGKQSFDESAIAALPTLKTIAEGTVFIGGATGFYLGKFAGEHLVATNNHVCPSARICERGSVNFTRLNKRIPLKKLLGTYPSIDLAIVSISPNDRDLDLLSTVKNPFDFDLALYPGQELITVGYGIANNPRRRQVGNWDSDCRVFSGEGEFRLMKDPDSLNPGQYETWSFANGCDVSHGDSGSAMIDRETGRVIGIIWTGRIPKSSSVQDSEYLDTLLENPSEEIWTELSYGVPAVKIREKLSDEAKSGQLSQDVERVFTAIVEGQIEN